jgi:deoxyribose-phosphate aldolase
LLNPALPAGDFESGVDLALEFGVRTVCVKPCDVSLAFKRLEGSSILVCSVIAFPHGNSCPATKLAEAERAAEQGAREIDYVINISAAIAGDFDRIQHEMSAMRELEVRRNVTVKAIFENAYLDDTTKTRLCKIARSTAITFVKTSTGFAAGFDSQHSTGANIGDVELMVRECAPVCQVKASGGIRTLEKLERFLDAGATRIGTSSTREIMQQARRRSS